MCCYQYYCHYYYCFFQTILSFVCVKFVTHNLKISWSCLYLLTYTHHIISRLNTNWCQCRSQLTCPCIRHVVIVGHFYTLHFNYVTFSKTAKPHLSHSDNINNANKLHLPVWFYKLRHASTTPRKHIPTFQVSKQFHLPTLQLSWWNPSYGPNQTLDNEHTLVCTQFSSLSLPNLHPPKFPSHMSWFHHPKIIKINTLLYTYISYIL